MNDIKIFAKIKNDIETLTQTIRIFSKDIGMTFGIEKTNSAMLTMKRRKIRATEGTEIPNKECVRTLGDLPLKKPKKKKTNNK